MRGEGGCPLPTVIVEEGDCFSSLAESHGFGSYLTVYQHGGNTALRSSRPNPNMLVVGDSVELPEPTVRNATVATGREHPFRIRRYPVKLRLMLVDVEDQPIADKPYRLEVGSQRIDGVTPGNGLIEHVIPASATSATLLLDPDAEPPPPPEPAPAPAPAAESPDPPPYPPPIVAEAYRDRLDPAFVGAHPLPVRFELAIGSLPPAGELTGVQGRLKNLGFDCRREWGEAGPATTEAVKAYQRKYGGAVTGTPADIQADLEQRHDAP